LYFGDSAWFTRNGDPTASIHIGEGNTQIYEGRPNIEETLETDNVGTKLVKELGRLGDGVQPDPVFIYYNASTEGEFVVPLTHNSEEIFLLLPPC